MTDNFKNKEVSSFSIFIRLSKLFKPHSKLIILGLFLSIITILANVALMSLSGWFLASMAVAGVAKVTMNYLSPAAGIRVLAIARAFGRYFERLVNHSATLHILSDLRHWFYKKIEPLAPAILQKYHSGDVFSRIKSDIDTLENVYVRIIVPIITTFITSALFVFFMYLYDVKLAIIEAFSLITAGFIIPLILLTLSRETGKKLILLSSQLRQYTMDSIQGLGELLIYGASNKQAEKINKLSHKLSKAQYKMAFYNGLAQASLTIITGLTIVLVITISTPIIRSGEMPAVNIAMLVLFSLASFEAVMNMPEAFQLLPETIAAGRRIFEMTDSKPSIVEPNNPSPTIANFDIAFENVSFSYTKGNKNVLKNLSFTLKEGERLALVGRSGIGKSTVINLLTRFYDYNKGEITIGSNSIKAFQSDDLRQYISVASQQNQLFNNTIRENLLLAKPDANDNELDKVCKITQIYDFIKTLPDGYDTWSGELGYKFSGGQKKRLTIARALLKPSKILILDEPGEGLDRETEKEMLKAIFEYKKSTSILIITHSEIKGIKHLKLY